MNEAKLAKLAWDAAQQHIAACELHLYLSDNFEEDPGPSPASAPYDGCSDCIMRETLHAVWPILAAGSPAPAAAA